MELMFTFVLNNLCLRVDIVMVPEMNEMELMFVYVPVNICFIFWYF